MSDIDPRVQTMAMLFGVEIAEVRRTIHHVRRTLGHDVADDVLVEQTMDLLRRARQDRAVDAARRSIGDRIDMGPT